MVFKKLPLIKYAVIFITSLGGLIGVYLVSRENYLLFHSFVEIFSIVIAVGIFMIFWNTRRFLDNNYYIFVGVAYVFVAMMDFLHTLAYAGMGVFPRYDANLPTQLWIASRYLESLIFLVAPLLIYRKVKLSLVFAGFLMVVSLLLASIFYWNIFPDCLLEGTGLTSFKKTSEYIISIILVAAILLNFKKRDNFDTKVFWLLNASLIATILSELSFTLYSNVYGLPNFIGHIFKIISFYLIYKAFVSLGLTQPYSLLFRELKQSEQVLERRHRELVEAQRAANLGSWSFELSTSKVTWSEELYRIFTLDPADGPPAWPDGHENLYHPDDWSRSKDTIQKAMNMGESYISENRIICADDDSVRYTIAIGNPQHSADGDITGYIGTVQDITKRVQVEKALKESEVRFRLMFQRHDAVMLLIDPENGRISDANLSAKEFYGYSKTTLCKMSIQDINILSKEEVATERQLAITQERSHFIFSHQLANGDIRIVEVHSSPVEIEQKELLFSIIFDITKRKQVEEEKRQLEIHLRQHQKLESIGTLASGVAHEINNPIMGIMNYAQLIHDRIDPTESRLREFSAGIIEETERVAEIVRNLLTFSRQEKQDHSPARIADIVNGTLSLIRTVIKRDQITLDVDLPDYLPKIQCRIQQIQQVIMNLLTNARDALNTRYPDYDPDKVITVSAHPFEKDGRKWLRTTVEDHGGGIPVEIQERIFDPFYTTKDRATGTGLGLSISLGIVQDHHGELTFESEKGQPTRFHLDLPVDNGWETV